MGQYAILTNTPAPANALPAGRALEIFNRVAPLVLLLLIGYAAAGRLLVGAWPPVDYQIIYDCSHRIVASLHYDAGTRFPYPPSAVVLFWLTALPPLSVAALVWLACTVTASMATFVLGMKLVGLSNHPARWLVALGVYALTSHYTTWDLRCQNCNMVYLFLLVAALVALERGWDILCGFLLAASIAIKLYPVLVLGYLLWRRRWRAAAGTAAGMGLFFVALPLAMFGLLGATRVYASWFEHVSQITSDASGLVDTIVISIPVTLVRKLGAASPWVGWLSQAATVVWLSAIGVCLLTALRRMRTQPAGWNVAVDAGVLALAPVVVSPYLESYHAVAAILPLFGLLGGAVALRIGRGAWLGLLGSLACGWLALHVSRRIGGGYWGFRGIGIYVQMLLLLGALVVIKRAASGRIVTESVSSAKLRPRSAA